MKKIIILSVLVMFAFGMQAQMTIASLAKSVYSKTSDTATNSETLYMYLPDYTGTQVLGYYREMAIEPYVTNVSGTLTGACYLQALVGGTWVTQNVGNNSDMIAVSDTLSLTSGGNTSATIWYLKSRAQRYRVVFACTGTAVDKLFVSWIAKDPNR